MGDNNQRINPDALLELIHSEDQNQKNGKLRVFLGMSAGVGKTYAMLKAAHKKQKEGVQVLVGLVETHGRSETADLLEGLTVLPRKKIKYRDTEIDELDIDAILNLKPELVVIDELAHTNSPGSRHAKRYQDILEILQAGISVYTALNVQHLESRKDSVERITGIIIRETVPDSILERAQLVELVDIAPTELLKRLQEGKVYLGEKAQAAIENFFKEDKLTALREIALRMTAEKVDHDLQKFTISRDGSPWQTNERLLVAVSHSPYSEKIIRATRRLAYNLEAPWIALHVDTGLNLSDEDQEQLQKNLNLARELNAEVIHTSDSDVATAIKRISRQKNVTQVVVGRSAQRFFRNLIEGGNLLDRLMKDSQEVDIHVIRHDHLMNEQTSLKEDFSLYRTKSGWVKYYYVAWFFVFVTIIGALFEPYIGYRAVGFIFLLAVVITSLWGSIGAVLFSASLSAVIWNLGFIPPRFTIQISSADDMILFLSNFVVALAMGFLTNRLRIREKLIREREEKTNLMILILQDISSSPNKSEFIQKVCARVSQNYQGHVSVVLKSKNGNLIFDKSNVNGYLNENEQAVALWSFQNQKNAGWSTETLSQAQSLYIPLKGVAESIGVLIYRPELNIHHLSMDQKEFLLSVGTQLGISIERHFLSRRLQESQRLKDSELLFQTLLNSISHEMRTPLTAIMGVSSSIEKAAMINTELKDISGNLNEAGDRLNRVVENLLDMSRLNSGVLGLHLEWHDVSDLIGVVLKKVERNLKGRKISVSIPENLGLISIDYRLFEHAISNLVLNALQYAGADSTVEIVVKEENHKIKIIISDTGPGVPLEYQGRLFEKFYRVPGTPAGGTGLGLSIVQGIVELHHGRIYYAGHLPHGSSFVIELPLKTLSSTVTEELS